MHVEFEVVKVDPSDYGIVAQDTVIYYGGEPFIETRCNKVATCANKRSLTSHAALSIPFIIVRLVYTLINGFDKQLLISDGSIVSTITRAAMVILMEVFILTLFSIMEFCIPY